jgi:hypothetical protein
MVEQIVVARPEQQVEHWRVLFVGEVIHWKCPLSVDLMNHMRKHEWLRAAVKRRGIPGRERLLVQGAW